MIELTDGVMIDANSINDVNEVGFIKPTKANRIPKDFNYVLKVSSGGIGREYILYFSTKKLMQDRAKMLREYIIKVEDLK